LTLGQRTKKRRIELDLTLRELADKVNTDFTYLSKIENDKTDHPPSEDLLRRLGKHLDIDPDELIVLSGQVPPQIREAIAKDPAAVQFFRSFRESRLGWDELKKLVEEQAEKKK
jgi:transcriptional regulator with XRE-family HTH domain